MIASSLSPLELTAKDSFVLVPRTIKMQSGGTHTFSSAELAGMVSAFKGLGRPLVIDFEHQTLGSLPNFSHFMSPDGTAPAAGWIGDLEVGGEGIIAKSLRWTPRASKMIADGEYRYFSPVVYWKGKPLASEASALGPVALTNDPDISGLEALAARADPTGPNTTADSRQALHETAAAYAAKHGVPYADAVCTVAAGGGELSPDDQVSASAAFQAAPVDRQQLHRDAMAYMQANKCDYATAVCELSARKG